MRSSIPFVILTLSLLHNAAGAEPAYRVMSHYDLGGSEAHATIRIDAEGRRLYVAHGNGIDVVDADSGQKAGFVDVGASTTGIALALGLRRGFCSREGDLVTIFDLDSLKVIKVVKSTGRQPEALEYDTATNRVFVANRASGDITAIDAATGEAIGIVPLAGQPGQLVANGYGWLFAAVEDKNAIRVIDTRTLKLLGDFPTGQGRNPTGLALEPVTKRLFAGCANGRLAIIDSDVGFPFVVHPMGSGASGIVCDRSDQTPPRGDPKWKGRVFAVAEDGTLSIVRMISPVKWALNGSIKISPGAHSIAFDPKTNRAFVPVAKSGSLELVVIGP